jgi:phage terminase large subunit-like protein
VQVLPQGQVASSGSEAVEFAELVGVTLDPWQRHVLEVSLGERADGSWSAKTVDVLASRQNGKNAAVEIRELFGAVVLGERVLHTAHEFKTSLKAHARIRDLIGAHPDVVAAVKRKWATPAQGYLFEFHSGGKIEFVARSGGSGRGFTEDVLILDEAQALTDDHLGALMPALSARSVEGDPQVWYLGSAPSQDQVVWQRRRFNWRSGGTPTQASFEFSADPDADLDDRDAWAQANPGLGIRISEEFIAGTERPSMSDDEFAKERLSISPEVLGDVAALPGWAALVGTSEIVGPLAIAVDVSPDRRWTSIAVSGVSSKGGHHLEVIDHLPGTSKALDRLVDLWQRWNPVAVAVDAAGPAGSLLADLERAGVPVRLVSMREHGQACGMLWDDVAEKRVVHLGDPVLNAAVNGARRRLVGDAWLWDRKRSDVDISPLVAITLARWAHAATVEEPSKPIFAF